MTLTQSGASSTRGDRCRHCRHLPTICYRLYSRTAAGRIPMEGNTHTHVPTIIFFVPFLSDLFPRSFGIDHPITTSNTISHIVNAHTLESLFDHFRWRFFSVFLVPIPLLFTSVCIVICTVKSIFFRNTSKPSQFDVSLSLSRPISAIETPPPLTLLFRVRFVQVTHPLKHSNIRYTHPLFRFRVYCRTFRTV